MTPQEIFDTAAKHILVQGPAVVQGKAGPVCLYRTPDGKKCAFGVLIPDDKYSVKMEKKPAEEVIVLFHLDEFEPHLSLITYLQIAHDEAAEASSFQVVYVGRMRHIAREFNLSAEVLP